MPFCLQILFVFLFWIGKTTMAFALILNYQGEKFGTPLGKISFALTVDNETQNYELKSTIQGEFIFKSLRQQLQSQGMILPNHTLQPQLYFSKKNSIQFQNTRPHRWFIENVERTHDLENFHPNTLDPLSSFWQIMPLIAKNAGKCRNLNYHYFNGKQQYHLNFTDNPDPIKKPTQKSLQIIRVFACTLTRQKIMPTINAPPLQHEIIFITTKLAPYPLIYESQITRQNIKITLTDISNQ